MNAITRDEFNARIETIEARMDARIAAVSSNIDAFLVTQASMQIERDKTQSERDKTQRERDRFYDALAERVTKAAEGAEEAARQAATLKANYWAATTVHLLGVAAILAGAYLANQANILTAMQTTMAAFQAGKSDVTQQDTPPLK